MAYFDDYCDFTSSLEIPELFHLWCAYTALASAAQRKVWYGHGKGDSNDLFQVSPNLYTILVAPAGRCGKSTSAEIVQDVLRGIEEIKVSTDAATKESIVHNMEKAQQKFIFNTSPPKIFAHCSMTLFANEMSVLIKNKDKDMVGYLNSLYDCRPVFNYNTKDESKKRSIIYPFLNILGNTTPKWIRDNVHEDVLEGGLTARTMLIHQDVTKETNAFPYMTDEQTEAKARVSQRLREVVKLGGRYRLSEAAIKLYETWYHSHHKTSPPDFKIEGYWWRKRIHVLKLGLLQALANHNDPIITVENLEIAFNTLKLTEPCIMEALSGVGRNELSPIIQEVLEQVKSAGKIETGKLFELNLWRVNDSEFNEIISTLTKIQEITTFSDEKGVVWTQWIGDKKLNK